MMSEMDEVIREFLAESREGLDRLERDLVALETQPECIDLITGLFRVLHTVKGTAGMLGFARIEKMAHSGEALLSQLRGGKRRFDSNQATALLKLADAITHGLRLIHDTGTDEGLDPEPVVDVLQAVIMGATTPVVVAPFVTRARDAMDGDPGALKHGEEMLRVHVQLLDQLMNLTSELVLARNQIRAYSEGHPDSVLGTQSQQLNFLTLKIQETVMKARLQPVRGVFHMFPRVVRDLAVELQKKARVEIDGAETELDKGVLDALRDPLMHLVRNCVDHGLERPEVRKAAGKNQEGVIRLSARHEAGMILVEVCDDGAGISLAKIRRSSIEKGLVDEAGAALLTDEEVISFIFQAGFTTKDKVTHLSGRGVGMDVVRSNVERVGGTIEVKTVEGQGTSFLLRLPLTLTIVSALMVGCGGETFSIPKAHVRELVLLREDGSRGRIEYLHDVPVYRLRGRVVPVVYLSKVLKMEQAGKGLGLLLLTFGERHFILAVDEILDFEDIVVKPLAVELKPLSIYSGSAIFRDGRVVLVLDVMGLAQRIHLVTEASLGGPTETHHEVEKVEEKRERVLLFRTPDDGRMAMPLSNVKRLVEFPREIIERAGELEVVQYGHEILPLIRITRLLPERRTVPRHPGGVLGEPDGPKVQVVVYEEDGREVGLVVDRVLDILETTLEVQRPASRKGVLGSMIIMERVTELLDVHNAIAAIDPGFYRSVSTEKRGKKR
jgi:two-component system chemotaxis sensor kinase CheA